MNKFLEHKVRHYFAFKRRQLLRFHRARKHPFAVPVVTVLGLSILTLGVFLTIGLTGGKSALRPSDSRIVIVAHDGKKETIPSAAPDVGALLSKLHITLRPGDVVEPSKDTKIVEDNFHINVYRAKPVTIVEGGHRTFAFSAATTPRSVAAQIGITTYPEDNLDTVPTYNFLREGTIGQRIVIDRATPVYVNLYGTLVTIRTHAKTVQDLLKDKNITLAKSDTVEPVAATPLTPNMQVFVARNGVKIKTVEEVIAAPTQTVDDSSLSFGTTAVRQAGSPGKRLVTYQVELKNGKEVGEKKLQEVVVVEPVKQIIARGKAVQIPSDISSVMAQAGIAPSDYGYVNYIISREGGWCATKLQGQVGYCPGYPPAEIPSYLGYGIGQATPGTKMAPYGVDWKTNPVTQLKWATSYAVGRYGSWEAAYNYWYNNHHW